MRTPSRATSGRTPSGASTYSPSAAYASGMTRGSRTRGTARQKSYDDVAGRRRFRIPRAHRRRRVHDHHVLTALDGPPHLELGEVLRALVDADQPVRRALEGLVGGVAAITRADRRDGARVHGAPDAGGAR